MNKLNELLALLPTFPSLGWGLGAGVGLVLFVGAILAWRWRGGWHQAALPRDFHRAFTQRLAQLQARRAELAGLSASAKRALQDPNTPSGAEVLLWQTLQRATEGAHRRNEQVALVALAGDGLNVQGLQELPLQASTFQLAQEIIVLMEQAPELAVVELRVRAWLPAHACWAGIAQFPNHERHEDWLLAKALAALDCARLKWPSGGVSRAH